MLITQLYTLSLHDALPICPDVPRHHARRHRPTHQNLRRSATRTHRLALRRRFWCVGRRSEEHTSELQSRQYIVCRLLLEKKNTKSKSAMSITQNDVLTYII